jgi:hypothetical protein
VSLRSCARRTSDFECELTTALAGRYIQADEERQQLAAALQVDENCDIYVAMMRS